ncbi:hypothetical protein WJ33_00860, partial [Burkholderia ubonensis]
MQCLAATADAEVAHFALDPARVTAAAADFGQQRVAPFFQALRGGTAAACGSFRLITRTACMKLRRSGSSACRQAACAMSWRMAK